MIAVLFRVEGGRDDTKMELFERLKLTDGVIATYQLENQDNANDLVTFTVWKDEAARLTLLVAQVRQSPASEAELTQLEATASAIYDDIASFKQTVDQVRKQSTEAAEQLAPASDALHLVLLEITELGLKLYSAHSGLHHGDEAGSSAR